MRNKPLRKWSNCILNDEETDKLLGLAKQYPAVKEFGEISPGIVTGANSFFILSKADMDNLHVPPQNILPIVTKSSKIPALLVLKWEDFEKELNIKKDIEVLNNELTLLNTELEESNKIIETNNNNYRKIYLDKQKNIEELNKVLDTWHTPPPTSFSNFPFIITGASL